jgi:hypothetical protein
LTQRAVPAAEIDAAVAQEQLLSSQTRKATTPDMQEQRNNAIAQSRAQLHIAQRQPKE